MDDANWSLNFAPQVVSKLLSLQRALRVSALGLALLKDKIAELVPALFSSSPNCEDRKGQSCPTLGHPMSHSTPGLPVHHQLPEFTQKVIHLLLLLSSPSVVTDSL